MAVDGRDPAGATERVAGAGVEDAAGDRSTEVFSVQRPRSPQPR